MARLGVTKKKKSPRATELSQLKKELQRVTEQLESRDRELAESTAQQTASSEILGVIASSPTDLQPVLDSVAENAARLCDANDAGILRVDGDILRPVASYGPMPRVDELPITRGIPGCRAVVEYPASSDAVQLQLLTPWGYCGGKTNF
jgi:hypothetical protein